MTDDEHTTEGPAADPAAEDAGTPGAHRGRLDDVLREAEEELKEFAREAKEELEELGVKVDIRLRDLRRRVADFLDHDAGVPPPANG
jgi:ElaB/YqjD/DUF883 family membrane-anchored ribosome-binding protein